MDDSLNRYRPLIDDWEAFCEASTRPIPKVVWANPLRADPGEVAEVIRRHVPAAEPVPWWPHTWRLPAGVKVGDWLAYRLGWMHAQEEAALWAVEALGVGPGARVLDLCAAPGNKAAQLAVMMQDQGLIVANDGSAGRLAAMRGNLERLGVTCAVVARGDGRRMMPVSPPFDAVLVDAPCSCEGTTRKPRRKRRPDDGYRDRIQGAQIGLLRAALRVVKPGGAVVYATCTYAPEENEAVLDAIDPDDAVIEPIVAPRGLRLAPGITEWQGRVYRPDVRHACRLWPHHNDTGGFFVAKLRHRGQ